MKKTKPHRVMEKGVETLDALLSEPERLPKVAGSAAGIATPALAVAATAEVTGLAGGAAILKTLAVAGSVVGGGAVAGIAVVGIGAVTVGWGVTKLVKKLRTPSQSA